MAFDDGALWDAVSDAVEPILDQERELDRPKLEKRIRDCFAKAAKGLSMNKPFEELVNDYADAAFQSLWASLGDREWLPEADFLLVLDAAVKENLPPPLISSVPQMQFEKAVLRACDRAGDECRYQACSWECINKHVSGKASQKKVREALEEGRAKAIASGAKGSYQFLNTWVAGFTEKLAEKSQGDPESALGVEITTMILDEIIQAGGLPNAVVEKDGQPEQGWPAIGEAVATAYLPYAQKLQAEEAAWALEKANKKKKKGGGTSAEEASWQAAAAGFALPGAASADWAQAWAAAQFGYQQGYQPY